MNECLEYHWPVHFKMVKMVNIYILLQSKNQKVFFKKIPKFLHCKTSQNLLSAKNEFVTLQGEQRPIPEGSTWRGYFERWSAQMLVKQGTKPDAPEDTIIKKQSLTL